MNLFKICSNIFYFNKEAQEFNFFNIKLVFIKFIKQVICDGAGWGLKGGGYHMTGFT